MKIKVTPEDFIVEELIDVPLTKRGPYTILKLNKWAWNTLDVIDFVSRRLHVPPKLFSRAGLKDRYALATQYLSFRGDFPQSIKEKHFTVVPLGKSQHPITFRSMHGNKFTVTLRQLRASDTERIKDNVLEVMTYGLANYFDEQRFGSAKHGEGFFAKRLMLGHYKGALQLIVTAPFKEDTLREKRFKRFCREHWGQWAKCLNIAPPSYKRMMRVLTKKRRDYKGAIKTISRELLNLYLLAYQSYIFNESLKRYIAAYAADTATMPYTVGSFLFHRKLADVSAACECTIPMVNEKTSLHGDIGAMVKSVLDAEGITLKDFSLRAMRFRGVRFKSFERKANIIPERFTCHKPTQDDLYRQRKKMTLAFTLPAGSYATLLLKRLAL